MPVPDLTPLGARLQARTQPLAPDDELNNYAHALLCEALSKAVEQVAELFDPEGDVPPGAPLLDVELCPDWALPWLAQIVGVTLPAGVSPDDARVLIADVAGWDRGTPDALRAAAGFYLTDTKTVYFRERYGGNAYALQVVTLTSETPDQSAVLKALLAQKPGGIVLDYHTVTGWDYTEMTTAGGVYTTLATHYATYNDLRDNKRTG